MRKLILLLIAFECVLFSPLGVAASLESLVENTSGELVAEIKQGRETFNQDPNALYLKVDKVLVDFVDFPFIARGVMGKYYQVATAEQRVAFLSTFRTTIIELLTKTLVLIESEAIRVLPLKEEPGLRASVVMEVSTKEGQDYRLVYSMAKDGNLWQVRNIIVDGINLGLIYRNQFRAAMDERQNDIDSVIRHWRPLDQIDQ